MISWTLVIAQVILGFPGGSDGKESACSAGNLGLIPRWWRYLGEGNGYCSSILTGIIPWREMPDGLQSMGLQLDTTEWLSACSLYIHFVEIFFFFIINECGILSKAFFWIFWEDHSISIFQFANVICNSDRFAAIESFLHSWDQSTWLWYMIFSGYCRVQFVNICWGFLNLCSSETLTSSVVPLAFY